MGFLVSDVPDNRRNIGSAYAAALSLVPLASGRRLRFSYRRHPCRLFALSRCPSPSAIIPLALRYKGSALEGLLLPARISTARLPANLNGGRVYQIARPCLLSL